MLAQITDLFELRARPATRAGRPTSTLAFDWLYTLLMLLFTVGFMLDVWSHSTFGPDQSVLSEYHLMFYTCAALMGLLLVGAHWRNVGVGYRFEQALPHGYGFALLGILGFGVSGGLDLVGHALFGFENTDEALLSPTHLGLFITWAAMATGPVLALMARRTTQPRPNLWQSLPGLVGFVAMLVPFTVMLLTVGLPFSDEFTVTQAQRLLNNNGLLLGFVVSGFYVQTLLVFGFLIWLVRAVRLPLGSFVFMMALYGLTLGLPFQQLLLLGGVSALCGLAVEIVYRALRPHPAQVWTFRAFGFLAPVAYYMAYFSYIIVTNHGDGIGMSNYMWLGIVFQQGLLGFGIAAAMTLAPVAPDGPREV